MTTQRNNWLVFCAHDSQRTLPAMMKSFKSLSWHRQSWQIVAVNNAATDKTRELLQQAQRSGLLTLLNNRTTRKNAGLNLALDWIGDRLHDADLVAFTDDDITAHPEWLVQLEQAARGNPTFSLFGGKIEPVWPAPMPQWLQMLEDQFDMLYARTHPLSGPCDAHFVYGPNMAIRAELFANGLRFDAKVGPENNRNYRMGSETELLERLEAMGHRAFFVPDAMVYHHVRRDQMTPDFVIARAHRHGIGKGFLAGRQVDRGGSFPSVGVLTRLLASEIKLLATYLPPFKARRVRVRYGREWLRGYANGYCDGMREEGKRT